VKIILHGILAERFGAEHEINTSVPADAIEGLSRQITDWPRDLLIDVIGFETEEALRAPTAAGEIHLMPAMRGGGGKWGKIIIGSALIAASFIPFLAPVAPFMQKIGVALVLSGLTELLMKAPSVDKSNDPPASKYLGINRNTTAVGTPIALAWGRVKIAGQWLSLQSDATGLVTTSFPANPA
jgi:predicted phage tail protein